MGHLGKASIALPVFLGACFLGLVGYHGGECGATTPLQTAASCSEAPRVSDDADANSGEVVGSGDGLIHIIPSLSAPSVKNGSRVQIQAVVKSLDGVAKVEATIERESTISANPPAASGDAAGDGNAGILPARVAGGDACVTDYLLAGLLDLPVATLDLKPTPLNLGAANATATMGIWQAEWEAQGLEETYYCIAISVTDCSGRKYTDRSLRFSDPIAGNNVVGSTDYPNGGMRRLDAIGLQTAEPRTGAAVIDASGGYAYFGTWTSPGRVVKVALGSGSNLPTRIGTVTLDTGEDYLADAVIDASGGYAYFGTSTSPGRVVKVALGSGSNPPTRIGAVTLDAGEYDLAGAVIDASSGYAYFSTYTGPGRVVKVALGTGPNPPTRVGAVTLNFGESQLTGAAVIDGSAGYAYFGTFTSPGRVVKVALGPGSNPPTRVGALTLDAGENYLASGVIDASAGYAYFGTYTNPGRVVKVALGSGSNLPTRIGTVTLNTEENSLYAAAVNTAGGYAYFGVNMAPARVVKVAMGSGSDLPARVGAVTLNQGENDVAAAVIDVPAGFAYVVTADGLLEPTIQYPAIIVKVALGSEADPPTRVGALTLDAGEDNIVSGVIDASNGYAYFGTYTLPGRMVKIGLGSGSNPPTRLASLTQTEGVGVFSGSLIDPEHGYAYLYHYFAVYVDAYSERVEKVALGSGSSPPTRVGYLTLDTEDGFAGCAVIDPGNGYAYLGTDTEPGRVVKVALGSGLSLPTRVGSVTLNEGEDALSSAVIDAANGYAYFGTHTQPGRVVKVALGSGSSLPARVGSVALNDMEDELSDAVIDTANGYAYFGAGSYPSRIVKVALGSGSNPPVRAGALTLNSSEGYPDSIVIDAPGGYMCFATECARIYFDWPPYCPGELIKVALGNGSQPPTRVGSVLLNEDEYSPSGGVFDATTGYVYTGTLTYPGIVVRTGLSQKGFLKATKFMMPEIGSISSVSFYSHKAAGNLRLAVYDNGAPPALRWQSASVANTATNGWVTVPISSGTPSSFSLPAGTYWLAWQLDTSIPVASYTVGALGDGLYVPMGFGPFPAALEAGTGAAATLIDERWSAYITYSSVPTGSLQVTISPAAAVTAGAQWRVDSGAWQTSGSALSELSVGQHTVDFKPIAHWYAPESQTVTIINGETTAITGAYKAQGVITCNVSGFMEAGTRVVLTAPEGSDYRWFLEGVELDGCTARDLIFDPVGDSDAGTYVCFYNLLTGGARQTVPFELWVFPPGSLPAIEVLYLGIMGGVLLLSGATLIRRRSR